MDSLDLDRFSDEVLIAMMKATDQRGLKIALSERQRRAILYRAIEKTVECAEAHHSFMQRYGNG